MFIVRRLQSLSVLLPTDITHTCIRSLRATTLNRSSRLHRSNDVDTQIHNTAYGRV